MLLSVVVLALLASVQGRAVNISNTWVLPEEGFPVFYRYFRDRISWYEADAVCQFHHANLVTVDTTAQYDAVRAYLKELDISSAVWIGLIRSNPDGDFTWTDYRGLSGDGYWSAAPDARTAPLCAAADPVADYRWEARACGGPTVASFICELPVPQWALGNEGCMVRALPALTILYLPESAAVQLTADCGMADVKKVQCTGNVKRENLLKELSCADEEELSSTSSLISTGSSWSTSTDFTFTDQDTTNEVTTEESLTTEHETENNQSHVTTATSLPHFIYPQTQYKTKSYNADKFNRVLFSKSINLGENQDNNEHSNFIPKIENEDNVLTNDQLEKLEDERHMKHKMLHEEIARVGNVENIFTQPTDHFIPPLVMAKAKLSDDMTVLSLAEKHAQQLAEKQFSKQNLNNVASDRLYSDNYGKPAKSSAEDIDKPLIASVKPTKFKDYRKETLKSNLPKKYINEKHYDVKNKVLKNIETKVTEADKTTETSTTTESTTKYIETTTKKIYSEDNKKLNVEDDLGMDLTVTLKDASFTRQEQTSFVGDIAKLETIQNTTFFNYTIPNTQDSDDPANKEVDFSSTPETKTIENVTMNHEIIKITILEDNVTTTVYEMTSELPIFRDSLLNSNVTSSPFETTHSGELLNTTTNKKNLTETTTKMIETELTEPTTVPVTYFTSTISSIDIVTQNATTAQSVTTSTETTTSSEIITTTGAQNNDKKTEDAHEILSTTSLPITTVDLDSNTKVISTTASNESNEKLEEFNSTEYHEILMNMTDHGHTEEEDLPDSNFKSPLLSGEMEPMHRPARTRRPQQPNRNNFNPFRILG